MKQLFADGGCELLSESYVNSDTKLKYRCNCGNIAEIRLDKFRIGQRCRKCAFVKIAKAQRHSYEHVQKVFEDGGCELLSKFYDSGHEKLKYMCSCGNVALISFQKFRAGQRCAKCKPDRLAASQQGVKSKMYKPEITADQRIKERQYPEYKQWRRKVYERDDYTCFRCGERGGTLNAHHIQSYANNPDTRTDLDNGVTLCNDCHKEYHKKIEWGTATLEGWAYFTTDYMEPPYL